MPRIIKKPNVKDERPFKVIEREKVIRDAEDDAADIINTAKNKEESILKNASSQADEILASAQQEKEEILNQARAEGEELKEQARQEGHQQGLNEGMEEARQKVAGLLKQLKNMITEGQGILEKLIYDQEQEIRKLVAESVTRVIQLKVEEDDEVVVRVAQACIRMAADRQSVRVLVHPEEKEKVEEWVDDFMKMFDDIEKINISIDTRVRKGGVIIESGTGGIDGRIDKQVEILNESILNQ